MVRMRLYVLDTIHYAASHNTAKCSSLTTPKLSRRSQEHSQVCSQVYSQLNLMTLPACLTVCSQVSSQNSLKHTSEYALRYTPNFTRWYTPSLLICTLPACLTVDFQVSSQDALKHTPEHPPKYTLCNGRGRTQVMWMLQDWTRSAYREDKNQNNFSKSCYCLLYKRTSKERRKGNPPTLSTLSLYTIRLPPSNHPSCSDVPSESHPMILHTTPLFLIVTTTPPLLTSQHLNSLLYLY